MAADILHKAEHRSYRELAVVLRQMVEHWEQLGRWLPASHEAAEMTAGADVARRLLADLETHLQRYQVSLRARITGARRRAGPGSPPGRRPLPRAQPALR